MKNKKPIIALGALAVVGLIAGTIAYFTSEVTFDNVFKTAIYKTKSTETFESPANWVPGTRTPKTVVTKNEGNVDVAVRATMSGVWYDEGYRDDMTAEQKAQHVISSGIPADAIQIELSDPEDGTWTWIDNTTTAATGASAADGYYYYGTKLAPNATTNTFINAVTLNANVPVVQSCDDDAHATVTTDDEGNTVTTKTCTTSIAGLGKATYILTITIETVQFDKYDTVWTTAPTISNS